MIRPRRRAVPLSEKAGTPLRAAGSFRLDRDGVRVFLPGGQAADAGTPGQIIAAARFGRQALPRLYADKLPFVVGGPDH